MPANARAFPRYEVQATADVAAPSDLLLYHRIQNISLGGICIQTKSIEEVGQLVDVVLNFPELGQQIEVMGQVVWTNREPPQDVGIRWVGLDEPRKQLLSRYITMVKTREISNDQQG
jgi:Tfp pilus assembly protein PilZ